MTDLVPSQTLQWPDVYQLETTDRALAGSSPGQVMNRQAQAFVDRFAYLVSQFGTEKVGSVAVGPYAAQQLNTLLPLLFTAARTAVGVDTIAQLKTLPVPSVESPYSGLAFLTGEGGGISGMYMWNETSTATADDRYVVQRTGTTTGRWLLSETALLRNAVLEGIAVLQGAGTERLRMLGDLAFLAFYNAGATTRRAFLRTQADGLEIGADAGNNVRISTNGVERVRAADALFTVATPATFNGASVDSTTATFATFATPTTLAVGGSNTQNLNVAQRTGSQTINIGTLSNSNSVYNFGTGPTASGAGKSIALGTGGVAGSSVNTVIGSSAAAGTITLDQATSVTGALSVGGDVNASSFSTASASTSIVNTIATTVNFAGAATALTIGATTGTATLRNPTIVGAATTQALFNTVATTMNFAGAATAVTIGATTGTVTLRNPTLVGASATQSVFNTVATTVNAFGAATTLSLGAATGNTTINNETSIARRLSVTQSDAAEGGEIQLQDATTPWTVDVRLGLLRFISAATVRARLEGTRFVVGAQNVVAAGGDLQISNSITFPATQVASTDPNTLDDYEEGSWTPSLEGSTTPGTATYVAGAQNRIGRYTKVGNRVHVTFTVGVSAFNGTGAYTITGLPFVAAANSLPVGPAILANITFSGAYVASVIGSGESRVQLLGVTSAAGSTNVTVTGGDAFNRVISGSITYEV